MHQDATWYGGRPQPRGLSVRWGSSPLPKKGAEPGDEAPKFRPMSVVAKRRCMDQDATWYGGRPLPTRHCIRCGPSYPQKKGTPTPSNFWPMSCGRTAGWMKTPLGTEVDLGPGHIVLDGVPAPGKVALQPPPLFSAHVYIVATVAHLSYC